MKKQVKGMIFVVIFGGGLLFWATAASMPNIGSPLDDRQVTITGTPADSYPDDTREQFCETGGAMHGRYVQEYKIPTYCTQPLAITTDPQGNVWFAQTNVGQVAKFDPMTEEFVEYHNPNWPKVHSMMWGMDYSQDGSIWYTDEVNDSIWRFSIQDEEYIRAEYPTSSGISASDDSLPQRLKIQDSRIIVNDFTGGKLTFLEPGTDDELSYTSLPSPVEGALTGDFAIDSQNNIWYTNWIAQSGGVLVRFDADSYDGGDMAGRYASVFELPADLSVPNGVVIGPEGRVWVMDTASSFFFSFDPQTEEFAKYVTSDPPLSSYGNVSGVIKDPVSRPYWSEADESGRIIFNEQTANRIGVFDPVAQDLTEYVIPSKNANWADCIETPDCGLAQVLGFTIDGDKIWFTEWVENNIGVIDTSIPLPVSISTDVQEITLSKGQTSEISMTIEPEAYSGSNLSFITSDTSSFSDLTIESDTSDISLDDPLTVKVSVTASKAALATSHKVLIGVQANDVSISKYITVNIIS